MRLALAALALLLAACGHATTVRAGRGQPVGVGFDAAVTTTTAEVTKGAPVVTSTTQRASRDYRRTPPYPPYAVRTGACGGWANLVAAHFPAASVGTACRVLVCESGGNPNAVERRTRATGLFQILHGPTDPEANVALAASMFASRGWAPWSSSRRCWA